MEKAEESNESGYDGGSMENILSEPHYESVGKRKDEGDKRSERKESRRRGSADDEGEWKRNGNRDSPKEERMEGVKENGESAKTPNGHAKFCNGEDQNTRTAEEDNCGYDNNKVIIHAVIETLHNQREREQQIDNDSSESDDLYEKIEDVRCVKQALQKEETFESESSESHESNKEVVYSHVSIHRTMKRTENTREKREEKPMLQELVKVAEEVGAPPKIPTPPPFRKMENNGERTFIEEEYSYEPELNKSSSKLVLRTRSLLNLEEENTKSDRTYVRPPAVRMKITTAPDGTFVIDGRKATSELNLSEEHTSHNGKRSSITGDDLRKRKEEIFKPKELPPQDAKKYYNEINQDKIRTTKEEAIYNLKKYLKENNIGLRDLLTNNNVVIIDTYREKKSTEDLSDYNHKPVRNCRITGTVSKGETHESNTLPRANRVHQPTVQRHYFYSLFKHRPSPPDEELPDPDKVRSTRQMFQKSKEKLPPLGIMLPIAAKVGNPKNEARPTPEVRLINQGSPRRWTDSGSVSSGVSSDMSLLDNMSDKCYSSEDEDEEPTSPTLDTHPVSPEVLKKIRECGTTITYYGGRVIAHSHGPGNPMTMTIMNEIRQGRDGGCKGKFRLIKSNSCGSRLELAGTDEHIYHEMSRSRFYDDVYGGTPLSEEMRGSLKTVQEENKCEFLTNLEHGNLTSRQDKNKWGQKGSENGHKPSWRELIESRKQKRAMEHNRRPCPDMVFEEFQVLEA